MTAKRLYNLIEHMHALLCGLTQIFYTVPSQPPVWSILSYIFSKLRLVRLRGMSTVIEAFVLRYYSGHPLLLLPHQSSDCGCSCSSLPSVFLAVMKCLLTVYQKYSALNSKVGSSVVIRVYILFLRRFMLRKQVVC